MANDQVLSTHIPRSDCDRQSRSPSNDRFTATAVIVLDHLTATGHRDSSVRQGYPLDGGDRRL